MPVGRTTAEAAKKGAVELVKQIVSVAITETLKREALGISNTAAGLETKKSAKLDLEKRGRQINAQLEKHGGAPITGLSYSLAAANVLLVAREFPNVAADTTLDILAYMVEAIDNSVDAKYRKYLKAQNKAEVVVDTVSQVFGIPEAAFHNSVNWKLIYRSLSKQMRKLFQDAEAAQKKRQEKLAAIQKAVDALKAAKRQLRTDIDAFLKVNRLASRKQRDRDHLGRQLDRSALSIDHRIENAKKALHRLGEGHKTALFEKDVFFKSDAKKLREIVSTLEQRRQKAKSSIASIPESESDDSGELSWRLLKKVQQIQDMHWRIWIARKNVGLKNGKEPLHTLPYIDVPWRQQDRYELNLHAYPFGPQDFADIGLAGR